MTNRRATTCVDSLVPSRQLLTRPTVVRSQNQPPERDSCVNPTTLATQRVTEWRRPMSANPYEPPVAQENPAEPDEPDKKRRVSNGILAMIAISAAEPWRNRCGGTGTFTGRLAASRSILGAVIRKLTRSIRPTQASIRTEVSGTTAAPDRQDQAPWLESIHQEDPCESCSIGACALAVLRFVRPRFRCRLSTPSFQIASACEYGTEHLTSA